MQLDQNADKKEHCIDRHQNAGEPARDSESEQHSRNKENQQTNRLMKDSVVNCSIPGNNGDKSNKVDVREIRLKRAGLQFNWPSFRNRGNKRCHANAH